MPLALAGGLPRSTAGSAVMPRWKRPEPEREVGGVVGLQREIDSIVMYTKAHAGSPSAEGAGRLTEILHVTSNVYRGFSLYVSCASEIRRRGLFWAGSVARLSC